MIDFSIVIKIEDVNQLIAEIGSLFQNYGTFSRADILKLCDMPIENGMTNYWYTTLTSIEREDDLSRGLTALHFSDGFVKEEDQTIKADAGKPKLSLVPRQIIFDIAKVREYGLQKYGKSESWKQVDIQRYRDAAFRHFMAYLDDPQGVDAESGLSHLSHLACNIAFLSELEKNGKE